MTVSPEQTRSLLHLVRFRYPEWTGFDHPRFVKEEIDYKRKASNLARSLLTRETFEKALASGSFDSLIASLKKVSGATNLLYLGTPGKGDARLLHLGSDEVPHEPLCRQHLDLLYGPDAPEDRLERFFTYERGLGQSAKWTWATYLLFLFFPETEVFVKPVHTQRGLSLLDSDFQTGPPSAEEYARIRGYYYALRDALAVKPPPDMIDIQSLVWVADDMRKSLTVEFLDLLGEFGKTFAIHQGSEWRAILRSSAEEGRRNFEEVRAARRRGEDITELVLAKLLPHADTPSNRERGAWVSLMPALSGDVRTKHEGAGIRTPEEWPQVASALLDFFEACAESPDNLEKACEAFSASPYSKGFQSGMLTPMLNAIRPDDYPVINNKPVEVLNHFTEGKYGTTLADYPAVRRALMGFADNVSDDIRRLAPVEGMSVGETFDMFCHWLVAEKKYLPRPKPGKLREPFSTIFHDRDKAEWAFQFLQEILGYLGVEGPDDKRVALTLPIEFKDRVLRLEFADWIVLEFDGSAEEGPAVRLLLQEPLTDRPPSEPMRFASLTEADPPLSLYRFTFDEIREADEELQTAIETTYRFVGSHLAHYTGTPYRPAHRQEVLDAVFDPERRKLLLTDGLPLSPPPPPSPHPDAAFSHRAFELLEGIAEQPKKEFYLAHKEEFVRYIEEPFKQLFKEVQAKMPPEILAAMETDKGTFSRFLKNDYGRGGAWPHFWGAFYTKGGKRILDAQLLAGVDQDGLGARFYLGEHGAETRSRFLSNAQKYRKAFTALLDDRITPDRYSFGAGQWDPSKEDADNLDQWLARVEEQEIRVERHFSPSQVIALPREILAEEISSIFKDLYPLVLLAESGDPLPLIAAYLKKDIDIYRINEPYSLSDVAQETGLPTSDLERWVRAIRRKRQGVLYGPPGTGKTFIAKLLARHLIGGGNGFTETVQFHPAYTYEEFIQGIRPVEKGGLLTYPTVNGTFVKFCDEAARRTGTCVLIVDEINRANLSRVFGELMYLLEYRQEDIKLASNRSFRIPENVILIGTMNTADRSIALVDHALRRRFAFIPLYPNYEVLRTFHNKTGLHVDSLIKTLQDLNAEIADRNYEIGVSFFLDMQLSEHIEDIWRMEIEPYLEEYFFDQPARANKFRWEKVGAAIGL